MSLVVWLPLINNTKNQGLYNLPATSYNNSVQQTDGKLGKCYSGQMIYHLSNEFLGNSWSLCTWVKSASWSQYNDIILCKNTTSSDSCQFYFSIINGAYLNIGANGGSGFASVGYTFATNTWYHVAATYNGSTYALYINGEKKTSGTYTSTLLTGMNNLGINCRSMNAAGTTSTGDGGKKLNDVRIYDHALSAQEVKKLAQGLILHYPLNNSISLSYLKYDQTIYTEPDGSQWVRIFHHNNPGTSNLFASSDTFTTGVYKDANRWFDLAFVKQFKKFEFLVKQKTTSSASEQKYRWIQQKDPWLSSFEDVARSKTTWITTSGYTDPGGNYGGLRYRTPEYTNNCSFCINDGSKSDWMGAFGSWNTWNSGIPGITGAITTGYMDLYMKISDYQPDKVYDITGYKNHGTVVGSLTAAAGGPRYKSCIYFNGSSCIQFNPEMLSEASSGTISLWIKPTAANNGSKCFFSLENNTYWQLTLYGTSSRIRDNSIGVSGTGKDFSLNGFTANTWVHIAITYSSGALVIYRNGSKLSGSPYSIGGTAFNTINNGRLGSTVQDGYYWDGYMSDFRIYTTALSATEVAELYALGST